MDYGGQSIMVCKIIWALILLQFIQSANFAIASVEPFTEGSHKLTFNWKTTDKISSTNCMHLVEVFLSELRNIATDQVIELASNGSSQTDTIQIQCSGPETIEIRKTTEDDQKLPPLLMRYQSLSQSFDSLDWVPFQKRFINAEREPTLSQLAPQDNSGNSAKIFGESHAETQRVEEQSAPLYKKWWFWAIIGGVGIGAYATARALSHGPSMNVEIH